MEVYIVQEFSREDYDFSTDIKNHGVYINKDKAIEKAKKIFDGLKDRYKEEIEECTPRNNDEYDDEDDDYFEDFDEAEEVEFYIDDEKGFYSFSFGSDENYELHEVKVVKCILHED